MRDDTLCPACGELVRDCICGDLLNAEPDDWSLEDRIEREAEMGGAEEEHDTETDQVG